ncbi:MAG: hypothetical protein ACOC2W_04420, partial [bacterium]
MAYRKVIDKDIDRQLLGNNFTNDTSSSYNSLSKFKRETNFTGKKTTRFENVLTSFSSPISLENLAINDKESKEVRTFNDVVLNIDYSDLKSYIRFGNTLDYIKVTLNNIILKYPASLYVDSKDYSSNPVNTIFDHEFDVYTNITKFKIYSENIINKFGLIYDKDNLNIPEDNELRNLNLSYDKYSILYDDDTFDIIDFTG